MDIHMPDTVNRAMGKIDVPEVQDATHFADNQAWAQNALDGAAVASAAERDHAIDKSQTEAHRENLKNAAIEAVKEDIHALEAARGHEMTDDEIKEYAGGFLFEAGGKFTESESAALDTTWRGKFARWFGSKNKVTQVLMAAAVPAAITTGAALTGVGALAGGAVAARFGVRKLRGTSTTSNRDVGNRWQTLAGNDTTNAGAIDHIVTRHNVHSADTAIDDDQRVRHLSQGVVGLLTGSAEKMSHMDRRRARIGLGVAAGAAVAGGIMRFTDINPFRDAVNALGRRVFGVLEHVESPVEFHDNSPIEFHSPVEFHARNPLAGNSPIETHNPLEFHDSSPLELHNPAPDINSPIHTQNPFRHDDGWGIRNPFRGAGGGAAEEAAESGADGASDAADNAADEATSGAGPNADETTPTGTTTPGEVAHEMHVPEYAEDWDIPGGWTEEKLEALSDLRGNGHMAQDRLQDIFEHPDGEEARNLRGFFDWVEQTRSNVRSEVLEHGGTSLTQEQIDAQVDAQMERKLEAFTEFVGADEAHEGGGTVTDLPGTAEVPTEEVTLNVPQGEGFENTLQQQYGLTDAEAAQAYQAMRPSLEADFQARGIASGMYEGPDGLRISKSGPLIVNAEASRALEDYLHSIGRSLEDEAEEELQAA